MARDGFVHLQLAVFLIVVLMSFGGGYYLGKNSLDQSNSSQQESISTANKDWDFGPPYPEVVSSKTGLKTTDNDLYIRFPGYEDITYDEITYDYKGEELIVFKLNLKDPEIYGIGQKLGNTEYYYTEGYEYSGGESVEILSKQLNQKTGIYPASIYNEIHQIHENKNQIKMKKTYGIAPGYIWYKVQMILPARPHDTYYQDRYFAFETTHSILGTDFDESSIMKHPSTWNKNDIPEEFKQLDIFIETINTPLRGPS